MRFDRSVTGCAVLHELDLTIDAGQFVSIIGPSGCGKSTLVRLIAGLVAPTSGSVRIGDILPADAQRHGMFGFVPQDPALLPWGTVVRNVESLTAAVSVRSKRPVEQETVQSLIETVGLTHAAHLLPSQLSGGMKQRVSLARAFALDAPVLLMDEPFASLDELSRYDMRFLLLDLWSRAKQTVVFVTHDVAEAVFISDRVIVMGADGDVVADTMVDLVRPRSEWTAESQVFLDLVRKVRDAIRFGRTVL